MKIREQIYLYLFFVSISKIEVISENIQDRIPIIIL